jgi:hypothetical protein
LAIGLYLVPPLLLLSSSLLLLLLLLLSALLAEIEGSISAMITVVAVTLQCSAI